MPVNPPNNDAFKQALNQLNPEQRRAVDQIEGPVLVLAGPGTGKTQVLAARIGNILLQTDTRPQNILCLTFTDAGVNAMRQRLLTWIGPDAHRVVIMTYHSFCNRVIQENIGYFGTQDLEPASELEQIEIVRELLLKVSPEHPLRAGYKSPFQSEKQLRNFFNFLKSEDIKPGDIHKAADAWLKQLPDLQEFIFQRKTKENKKGDLKTHKIAEETARMDKLKSAADLFPSYNHLLHRAGRYEFEDMILWTLKAFQQHPELLLNYQERYLYVLVDEYQDTNGAQNQLLQLLLNYWTIPNIFIVGDDDQSIYEFQGARLQNLADFYQLHKENLQTVVLTENYRSAQPILDIAHRVIENNQIRAVNTFETPVSKTLHAAGDIPVAETVWTVFPDRYMETVALVNQIENLLASGTPPGEIAVIFAKHKQNINLLLLLEKKGIAYDTRRPVDIFSVPLVRQILDVFTWLRDEMKEPFSGEPALFRILHASFFEAEPVELAKLALKKRETPEETWRNLLQRSPWSFVNALLDLAGEDDRGEALPSLLERIFTRLGILRFIVAQPDKVWHLQVLTTLMNFVKSETLRGADGIAGLLNVVENMKANKVALYLQQTVRMGDGIQVLTAHGAKGLEFQHVFIPDCTKDSWEPQAKEGQRNFSFPPTLVRSGEEDAMESRRRLFFVAVTRAKSNLYLSSAEKDENNKVLHYARFLDETGLPPQPGSEDFEQLLLSQALLLGEPEKPVITLPEPEVFSMFLEHFALSAKGLNKYLRCPLAYYYEEVLKAPLATSEAAATGLAMHSALQHYFLLMQRDEKREFPSAEKLTELFEQEMERQRGVFSEQTYDQRLTTGIRTLDRYRTEQIAYWRKRAQIEFRFNQVEMDGVPLVGVVDKMEFSESGSIRVVDYKTGGADRKKVAVPSEENPMGGDFFRQLLFYKLLIENSSIFSEQVTSGVISWIEPDKKGNFRYDEIHFSKDQTQWMRDLIVDTAAKIRNLEFSNGCGEPECLWCRINRERMPDHIWQPEEALDD